MSEPTKISTIISKILNDMMDDTDRRITELSNKLQETAKQLRDSDITESLAKAQAMRDELAGWDAIVPTTDCAYCNSTGKCDDDNECGFCDNSLTTRMDTK